MHSLLRWPSDIGFDILRKYKSLDPTAFASASPEASVPTQGAKQRQREHAKDAAYQGFAQNLYISSFETTISTSDRVKTADTRQITVPELD